MSWSTVGVAILSGGFISGVAAYIRARADARAIRASAHQTAVQTEIAEDTAVDARWVALVDTQTRALLEPLTKKVEAQERRIDHLEQEIKSTRRLYRRTLDLLLAYVRHVAILAGILNDAGMTYPSPPSIPSDIHDDM